MRLHVALAAGLAALGGAGCGREAVEYSQNVLWSHQGAGAYPQNIAGLGLAAAWFPADRRLLVTDGRRLLAITVTWPGAGAGTPRRLAEALARGYLAGAQRLSGAR